MDIDLLYALLSGFLGGVIATRLPSVRINVKGLVFKADHAHIWNGSDGKHAGHVMQRCLVEGCKDRRWKPNG